MEREISENRNISPDDINSFSNYGQFLRYPEIFQWGLQDKLIRIAENYIQTPVAYDTFRCDVTYAPVQDSGQRRWHIDHEDRRMLKVFVYLNDVDIDTGPFEYLDKKATDIALSQLSLTDR